MTLKLGPGQHEPASATATELEPQERQARIGRCERVGTVANFDHQNTRSRQECPRQREDSPHHTQPVAGSVVTVTREGTRPLLVEVQVLVDETPATNPRRVAVGLDSGRLALLLAVIHRHAGVALHNYDVFANVVGGVRVGETAADLPAVLAVLSSLRDRPLPVDLVAFGEVGLAGEIRPVPFGEERLREAAKHGFRRAIVAEANAPKRPIEGLEVQAVRRLPDALGRYF